MSAGWCVYAATPTVQVQSSSKGGVAVLLAPHGVSVNVIEGSLHVSDDVFVDTSASIVSLWVEAPIRKDGVIRFAGVVPGGFSGMVLPGEGKVGVGELFSLRSERGARVTFDGGTAYLHDGVGTPVVLAPIGEQRIEPGTVTRADTQPPRITAIEITDGAHTDSQAQVMVVAVDKETGVNDIQIRYGEGVWQSVSMPFSLDAELAVDGVDVRVFDGAGNYVQQSVASSSPFFMRAPGMWYILVGVIALVIVLFVLLRVRKRT